MSWQLTNFGAFCRGKRADFLCEAPKVGALVRKGSTYAFDGYSNS
jgi:hypothetical protein